MELNLLITILLTLLTIAAPVIIGLIGWFGKTVIKLAGAVEKVELRLAGIEQVIAKHDQTYDDINVILKNRDRDIDAFDKLKERVSALCQKCSKQWERVDEHDKKVQQLFDLWNEFKKDK